MQLDHPYDQAQIRQFAGELRKLPHSDVIELERLFSGDQSAEYYSGLLSGNANALVIVRSLPSSAAGTLEKLVAFIADRIVKMEA